MLDRIRGGRTDLVFDLLAEGHGAASTVGGVSVIQWCAYHGDVSAVKHLLSHGESLGSLGPNLDLNGAAFHGHWQLSEFLLENGADPDFAQPDTGETALHAALCKRDQPVFERVVEILLARGADPNRAARTGVETGAFMRDVRTRGETPLHRAAAFGSERSIQMLLEAGADRRLRDAHGDSPLSWASWHLRPGAVLRLLATEGATL